MSDILQSARGYPIKPFIDIDWKGDVAKRLIKAALRMKNLEPLLRTIGRKVVLSVQRNIMEQRTPEGERWPGLEHPRAAGHNPGSTALFDGGDLYGSVDYVLAGETDVAFGYTEHYGRFHNDPDFVTATRGNPPARWVPVRRFLGLRDGDIPDIRMAGREHLEEAIAA